MAPLCSIRSAFPPPIHPGGNLYTAYDEDAEVLIEFRHPGYPDHNNILLVFPALDPITNDDETESKTTFGLHHETARLACAIAASNRWDGFLSKQKGAEAVAVLSEPDEILPAGSYYFHVPLLDGLRSPLLIRIVQDFNFSP